VRIGSSGVMRLYDFRDTPSLSRFLGALESEARLDAKRGDTRTVRDELRHFNQLLNLSEETVVRPLIRESGVVYRVLNFKTHLFILALSVH